MKCDSCGAKVIEYPTKNRDGSRNWKNTILGNPIYTVIAICILVIVYGVGEYTESCTYIKNHPQEFCKQWEEVKYSYYNEDRGDYAIGYNETFNFSIT